MRLCIENNVRSIENDNFAVEEMPPPEVLKQHPLFENLEPDDLQELMALKIEKLIQKD